VDAVMNLGVAYVGIVFLSVIIYYLFSKDSETRSELVT
jgi:hypothetical protein